MRRSPPSLFSKDTLARRCAKRFGWDPQHTAKLAQELYDQGYLSYPRTESEHLPESQTGDASAVIGSVVEVLTDLASLVPARRRARVPQGQQGPLRQGSGRAPRHRALAQGAAAGSISGDHLRLWELVAKSFLAAHLPDGIDARTTVAVQVATPLGPKRFSVSGSVIKSPGWRAVYGAEADEENETFRARPSRTRSRRPAACRPSATASLGKRPMPGSKPPRPNHRAGSPAASCRS